MKQLSMTSELATLIKRAVGEDVDPATLTVFEAIAINTLPLPGKDGTIFERAVVEPITLIQMMDHINGPNGHLPLVADHELFGAPKGRVFYAGLNTTEDDLELRILFYLDQTEAGTIAKLNAGSLDEVSVSFLSSQFLCSECGFDYFSGDPSHIDSHTCPLGHEIGEDGVHARMVGLNQFLETSLVALGAADTPKILGKSQSKLAPETTSRLAAKGFEPNALVVNASMGKKEDTMDPNATLTATLSGQVAELTGKHAVASADVTRLTAEKGQLTTDLAARDTKIGELETELATAKAATPEDYESSKTGLGLALTFLQGQFNHLRVAKGEAKLEGDALPKDVAELTAKINELTDNLTSIIPVDGVSNNGKDKAELSAAVPASAFMTRKD